jgi:RNA polymerase sigma-70 factor (ECF subfamily)
MVDGPVAAGGFRIPASGPGGVLRSRRVDSLKPAVGIEPSNPRVRAIAADPMEQAEGADERELLERCRAGDTQAFRTLVERHHAAAYRLALRIVRSETDAEEVAQDAFVRAWSGLCEFRGEAAFSTWLYRIVVRRALDRSAVLRNRRTRETDIDEAGEIAVSAGASEGPTATATHTREARRLERLLGALPETQRAAIALFYYEDLSVSDAARVLGVPEGTMKTHLSRARAALRAGWLKESRLESDDDLR